MVSTYTRGAGLSPYTSAPSLAMSAEERAAWAWFAPLAADKKASWLDPSSSRFYRGLGAADPAEGARLLDRCGDRVFSATIPARHPIIVTDSLTSRPVMLLGAGGSGSNVLDNNANGTLVCAAGVDARGGGDNNASAWIPGVGWSVAFKLRMPASNGVANGITFGAFPGGAVWGQAVTADDTSAAFCGINQTTGYAEIRTKETSGSVLTGSTDRRDGAWHDYMMSYNVQTQTLRIWEDGVAVTPNTAASTDTSAVAGAGALMFGARGRAAGGPANRFGGFIAFAGWLQGPVLEDASARTAMRNLMAVR